LIVFLEVAGGLVLLLFGGEDSGKPAGDFILGHAVSLHDPLRLEL
jgi:hypothetical protein